MVQRPKLIEVYIEPDSLEKYAKSSDKFFPHPPVTSAGYLPNSYVYKIFSSNDYYF